MDPKPASLDRTLTWARHVLAADVLGKVLEVCRAAGVDALPVKGVLTGPMLYRDVGERPLDDVDVRVRPRDLRALLDAGARAGWPLVSRSRAYGGALFRVHGMEVDVESSVGPPGMCAMSVGEMIAHARVETAPLGFAHLAPELHEHAVLLCVNVFKDKLVFARRHALEDLARIALHPAFDVARFIATARRARVAALVWVVADWMARTRGDAAWRAVRDGFGARAPRRTYSRVLRALIESKSGAAMTLVARMASDDAWRRVHALGALALKALETGVDPG